MQSSFKFYICDPGAHHKNLTGVRRMLSAAGAEYVCCNDLSLLNDSFDVVLCMTTFYPPDTFPKSCKVIYGPQYFTILPQYRNHPMNQYTYDPTRFFYNTLSEWNLALHKRESPFQTLTFAAIPLGIDFNALNVVPPLEQRNEIMIYFKHRHPSCMSTVTQFLDAKQLKYTVFKYGSYTEEQYKEKLADTRFILWIGSHESQGWAFQEAQASNVPILVWNVTSMRDEFNGYWPYGQPSGQSDDLAATTANCWSDDCGVLFYQADELESAFATMNERLATFTPRKYIEDKLSLSATYQHLLRTIGL